MPHSSLKLIPGVDQNRTPALNEAAISESNLIRFIPDRAGVALPQKIGGWVKLYSGQVETSVRALHAWSDTNANSILGVGSEGDIFTLSNSIMTERSPSQYSIDIPLDGVSNYFETTSGSSTISVHDEGSNVSSFDEIYLNTQVSIGGLILFGYYNCRASTADVYEIDARNLIGQLVSATSTATGGDLPVFDTTSGSEVVVVTFPDHQYSVGDTFPVLLATTVGGLTISGNYTVVESNPGVDFSIVAQNAATSTQTKALNNGEANITYLIGQTATAPSLGFGDGTFGDGGFGVGVSFGGGREFSITSLTVSGKVVTVDFSSTVTVPVNSFIEISGYGAPYDGKWSVRGSTSVSSTVKRITYLLPAVSVTPVPVPGATMTVNLWQFGSVDDWSIDNWGGDMIACPPGGLIYYWSPTGGAQRCIALPNGPQVNEGCFVAMPQRQIVAYGSTFNGIQDPLLVRWCDVGNYTRWVGTVTNQAGSYRIPKGSKIVGAMQGPQQGILWTDLAVWSMQYIGPPLVYSFNELGTGCGLIGRKAMGTMGGAIFWMSQSQFFTMAGDGVRPIPCPVWDVVFQDIDLSYAQNIRCAPNSRFSEVSWFYPTIGSAGIPTHYVKFNLTTGTWDYGALTRTAWIDQSVIGPPVGAGGDRFIYQHERGNSADGQPIPASFRTGFFTIQDGDLKTFIDQVWPDMKWGFYGSDQNASVSITFHVADYPGQTPRVVGPFTVNQATTYVTPRLRGRLVSIEISSDDQPESFWRLGNIRYRFQPDGRF